MPSASSTKVLCLLLVVTFVMTIGAASATTSKNSSKRLPGSCLMAASTLCANTDTNAMRCLRKLANKGDARVPAACAEALMAGRAVKNPTRAVRLSRMLNEGPVCAAGNACSSPPLGTTVRCNDVLTGCSGCIHNTHTITANKFQITIHSGLNPNGIACSNICCKADNSRSVSCYSATGTNDGIQTAFVSCSVTNAFV